MVPFPAFVVLLIAGLVAVGAIVGVAMLLAHPRTRTVGVVLISAGLVLAALFGVKALFMAASTRTAHHQEVQTRSRAQAEAARAAAELRRLSQQLDSPAPAPGRTDTSKPCAAGAASAMKAEAEPARVEPSPAAAKTAAEKPTAPATAPAKSGARTMAALGNALRRSLLPAGTPPSPPAPLPPRGEGSSELSALPQPAEGSSELSALPQAGEGSRAARPEWVDRPPCRVGDAYQMSIKVGPYTSRWECDAKLPEALQGAMSAYVETYLGPEAAAEVCFDGEQLRKRLLKQEEPPWEEIVQTSFGPMTQLHVLLEFDHKLKEQVKEARHDAVIARRLWYTGTGLITALGLLAVVFGYLKIDQQSDGTHRGRLRLAAVVGGAGVLLSAWMLFRVRELAAGPVEANLIDGAAARAAAAGHPLGPADNHDWYPSPDGKRELKAFVNEDPSDRRRDGCVWLAVREKARREVRTEQTEASAYQKWAAGWLDKDTVVLYSADVGTRAWQFDKRGQWHKLPAPPPKHILERGEELKRTKYGG